MSTKTERLNLRVTPADAARIKRAAVEKRRTITEFLLHAALVRAELAFTSDAEPEKYHWYEPVEGWGA